MVDEMHTDGADDVPDQFSVDFTGLTLLGTYRVERKLAAGGMGTLYLAEDTNLGRPVVVKVPHPRFLGEPGFRGRFSREIAELVRLDHPNIVSILARGEHEQLPFFVLQYLGGGSLEDRLAGAPERRLDPVEIGPWLRTIAETLDFVHARGIVHRDVKPENILYDESGHVFLSDFGVVKCLESEEGVLTGTGAAIGSPKYMAPEQGFGEDVGPVADQYALASTVFEALAGRPPFVGEKVLEVLMRKGRNDAPSLAEFREDTPPEAVAALSRGIARIPADRFPTCGDFAETLCAGLGLTGATPLSTPLPPPHRRSRRALVAVIAVLALAVAGLSHLLLSGRGDEVAPASVADDPVELTDAGAEPRQVLRYHPVPGEQEKVRMVTDSTSRMTVGDEEREPQDMGFTMEAEIRHGALDEEGRLSFAWEVTSCGLADPESEMPEAVAGKIEVMERLKGLVARGTVSGRGLNADFEFQDFDEQLGRAKMLLGDLSEGLDEIATPLPVQAVGVGARWEVSATVQAMGLRLTQTSTYELLSLEDGRARIRVESAMTAPAQSFDLPFTTTPVELDSFFARGGGEILLDLEYLVPLTTKVRMRLDMEWRAPLEAGGEELPMALEYEVENTIERR